MSIRATISLAALKRRGWRRPVESTPHDSFDPDDFDPPLQTRLLILQPTPFCNIDCSYCYLPDRGNRSRMTVETASLAVSRLKDDGLLGDNLTVVWHAGEPLVLPVDFYEAVVVAMGEAAGAGVRVTHSIQTNATLIDDAWCRFFAEHQIRIGVSVDGPADLHDRHRRTRTGKGTHAAAQRGLLALRRHGIDHHAIAVVTAASLEQADAIHAFFRDADIHEVGFNFDEAEGGHGESSLTGRDDAHRAFIEKMLAHMLASRGQFQVRELVSAMRLVAEGVPRYRWRGLSLPDNAQTLPLAFVNVAWNGDFSTFSPELLGQPAPGFGDFILGNVHRGGYLEASREEPFRRLWSEIRRSIDACAAACRYFDYCGGGAPANKLYENGRFDSAETLYCRSMIQRPFEAVLGALEATPPTSVAVAAKECSRAPAGSGRPDGE